jgi:Tol biopolymer transport system component
MKTLFTALVVVGLGTAILTAQATSPADLYQEAVRLQEVKGDLPKAIELYKVITTRHASDAVAPKALLRLAECYEILSPADAADTYRKLIAAYPAATESVAAARVRLASLERPAQGTALVPRRLSTVVPGGGISTLQDVSADGQFVLLNDLTLRSLATGQDTRIIEGSEAGRPAGGKLSPDAKWVVYEWRQPPADPAAQRAFVASIRVAPVRTGATGDEILPVDPDLTYVPYAWFPDGQSVLVSASRPRNGRQFLQVPIDHTPATVLASFPEERGVNWPRLSPDGRYIVFEGRIATGAAGSHLFVMNAAGGNERAVLQVAGQNRAVGWTEDGSHLLFRSNRGGESSLWAVRWSEGQAIGSPFLVRDNVPLGIQQAGHYFYTENRGTGPLVHVVDLTGDGTPPPLVFSGRQATWSPDGSRIAFLQRRAQEQDVYNLVIRTLATNEERTYAQTPALSPEAPQWLPSGDGVVVLAATGSNAEGGAYHRIDLRTGASRFLFNRFTPNHVRSSAFALSPDGTRTYHAVRQWPDAPTTPWTGVVAVRIADGVEEDLATLPGAGFPGSISLAASPDGTRVAVYSVGMQPGLESRLITVFTDRTTPLQVGPTFKSLPPGWVAWTSDSASVVMSVADGNRRTGVQSLDASGHAMAIDALTAFLNGTGGGRVEMSPDGRRALVVASSNSVDLFVLDNLAAYLRAR